MNQTTYCRTYQQQLRPTSTQERQLERVLGRCRARAHTALAQRSTPWQWCRVSVAHSHQEAKLQASRATFPEHAAIHSHVLQHILARLDRTSQAFLRRVAHGATSGNPGFQGQERSHSFASKEDGTGARLDNGSLVLSTIGRLAVRWDQPIQGTITTVTIASEADGWCVTFACAEVPAAPPPLIGEESGIDGELQVFLLAVDGDGGYARNGARRATGPAARPASTRASRTPSGATSSPFSRTRQRVPESALSELSEWQRPTRRRPRRTLRAVANGFTSP
jgi:putative transposase